MKTDSWASILIALAVAFGNVVWGAFVISRLWLLFVVPLGVPAVGVVHVVGLVIIANILRNPTVPWRPTPREEGEPSLLIKSLSKTGALGGMWGIGALLAEFS